MIVLITFVHNALTVTDRTALVFRLDGVRTGERRTDHRITDHRLLLQGIKRVIHTTNHKEHVNES